VAYVFTNLDRSETNPLTGNPAAAYAGQSTGGGESVTFTAWLEGADLYFGVTSRGELTGPNSLIQPRIMNNVIDVSLFLASSNSWDRPAWSWESWSAPRK
jgi:hypothetical protein